MVETYQQQNRSRPARQQGLDVQYRPIQIDRSGTAALAQATIGLGGALRGAAQDLQAVERANAEIEAREAQNAYIEDLRQLRFDPNSGYLTTTGSAALGDRRQTFEDAVAAARDARRSRLSPAAARAYDRATDAITHSSMEQAIRHDGSQLRAYANQQFEASAQAYLDEALLAYQNPELFQAHMQRGLDELARLGALNGAAPQQVLNSQRAASSQTIRLAAARLADNPNGGASQAMAFVQANRELMNGEDLARIENVLAPIMRQQDAITRVNQWTAERGSPGAAYGANRSNDAAAGVGATLAANPALRGVVQPRDSYTQGGAVAGTTMRAARPGAYVIAPGSGVAPVRMDVSGTTSRRLEIDAGLAQSLSEAATAVYGPGVTVSVHSGGQTGHGTPGGRRSGSTRHDHGGAADVTILDASGRAITGDRLAPMAQYWRARGLGGVGTGHGGLHLDRRTDRATHWYYGGETAAQRAAIAAGNAGQMPNLYAATAAVPGAANIPSNPPAPPPQAYTDAGMVPGTASLITTESGGNWQARNDVPGAGGRGHFGRLQFSRARLDEAARAGAIPRGTTPEQFLSSPEMQQAVERWHFAEIDQFIDRNGLDQFIGQTMDGVEITRSGLRAVAHLGGNNGMRRFLQTGGEYNPSDAYGTSLRDYLRRHASGGDPAQVSAAEATNAMLTNAGLAASPANRFVMSEHGDVVGIELLQADPGAPLSSIIPGAPETTTVGQYRASVSAAYGTATAPAPAAGGAANRIDLAYLYGRAMEETDPQRRAALLAEINTRSQVQTAVENETRELLFRQQYEQRTISGDWRVDAATASALGADMTASLIAAGRTFSDGVQSTDPVLYGSLVDLASSDPQQFVSTDLSFHLGAGRLSNDDYRRLAAMQTEVRAANSPAAQANAIREALDGVDPARIWRDASPTFQSMTGINVEGDPTRMSTADRAMTERFRRALESRIADTIRATGTEPNRLEVRAMIADMLTPVDIGNGSWLAGPTMVPRFDVEHRIEAGRTARTVPVGFNEIPDSIRTALGSQFPELSQSERRAQVERTWNDMLAVSEGRSPDVSVDDLPPAILESRVQQGWGEWVGSGFGAWAGEAQYVVEDSSGQSHTLSEGELLNAYAETRRQQVLHMMERAGITPDRVIRERQPHVYR